MSASGEEGTMTDQAKAKIGDQEFTKEEFLDAIAGGEQDNDEVVTIWAMVRYEEGTSGALKTVEGVLIDDSAGITVLDPETGAACIIGDRFIVRVDLTQVEDDEDEDETEFRMGGSEGDVIKDQVDTSADRFRA